MLANLSKSLHEKLKISQQQLRSNEERIVALETENAMLYLKLAQCQGAVRNSKEQVSFLQKSNEEDEKKKKQFHNSIIDMKKHVSIMKQEWANIRQDILKFSSVFQTQLSNYENNLVSDVLKTYHKEQSANTTDLNGKLEETEKALFEIQKQMETERSRRRMLHNTLVELRGNIRVHCRIRPLLAELDSNGDSTSLGSPGSQSEQVVSLLDEENIYFNQLNNSTGVNKTRTFEYERVYGAQDGQEAVFTDVAPLLTSLLDGYNVCIMAYGQTGSGKTHTMVGVHDGFDDVTNHNEEGKEGVIPRSAKEIFRLIEERKVATKTTYSIEVSVFEVYNNEIIDLLAPIERREVKHVVFSASDGTQEIPSLTTKTISSYKEVMDYVAFGMMHRREDSTNVHSHSSRSHLIVQLNVYQNSSSKIPIVTSSGSLDMSPVSTGRRGSSALKGTRSPGPSLMRRTKSPNLKKLDQPSSIRSRSPSPPPKSFSSSLATSAKFAIKTKLQLVDLAGSECVGMSGVTGSALRETSNINKSLSALADVLQALSESQMHIPYRNTKLTHVLQDTIGGDAKLLLMLCVSPARKYSTETLQCLGFGCRARQVVRGPAKKRRPTSLQIPTATFSDGVFCTDLEEDVLISNISEGFGCSASRNTD